MTDTQTILSSLEHTFDCAVAPDCIGWGADQIELVARPKIEYANTLVLRNMGFAQSVEAAGLYGTCFAIARACNFWKLEYESRSRFIQVLAWTVVPNRDESRIRAAELFYGLAEDCKGRRDKRSAAISLTNGALCILEMHNATETQLIKAASVCAETIRMRARNSVDYGYSQMNLALAERLTIKFSREPDKAAFYARVIRDFDRAAKVLKKHNEFSSEFKSIYHMNILETLMAWIEIEIDRSRERMDRQCIPNGLDSCPDEMPADLFVSMLRSNPAVFGYQETPAWVSRYDEIVADAFPRVTPLTRRLEAAEAFISKTTRPSHELRVKVFQLRSMIAPVVGIPKPPLDAIEEIWKSRDYEHYFIVVAPLVSWLEATSQIPTRQFKSILRNIVTCLINFRISWSEEDLERLMRRNPLTFRLAACHLAALEDWPYAFRLLEASRGLISSHTLKDDSREYESRRDDVSWVHVTHSPVATYVVMRSGDEYSGIELRQLSGRVLTAEFQDMHRGGLLSAIPSDRARASASAERICRILNPLAEWISGHSGSKVVLMLGGFYQAFPLWSCGALGEDFLSGKKVVTSVPSRAVAWKNIEEGLPRSNFSLPLTLRVQEATDVQGQGALRWARRESAMASVTLGDSVRVSSESATATSLMNAMTETGMVFFTGHSVADWDPLNSRAITYGNSLTVQDVLKCNLSADLVMLGSCESGLARNATLQDEMLSIQTSIYYSGAALVMGTAWPISDPAGFAFSYAFFDALRKKLGPPPKSHWTPADFISSHREAVLWMKNATIRDVSGLAARFGIDVIDPGTSTETAFSYYDWAHLV